MRSIVLGVLGVLGFLVLGCSTSHREGDGDDGGTLPGDAALAVDAARPAADGGTSEDAGATPTDGGERAPRVSEIADQGDPSATRGHRKTCLVPLSQAPQARRARE